MADEIESVITPERFAQGLAWTQWLEQITENRELFEANYANTTLNGPDVSAIKTMMAMPRGPRVWGVSRHGPGKILALCEPWCPDVIRGLPVVARLAEATGMELRIFFRDQNRDIMREVLYKGEFESIPTFVFYTKADEYLAHWIEMPSRAREEQSELQAILDGMNDAKASPAEHAKYVAAFEDFQRGEIWDSWRQAQVEETCELLAAALEHATRLEELRDMALFD